MDSGGSNLDPRATRSPLACLACRSRHVKCDGGKPRCSRCTGGNKECIYTRSRRGGLDRAYLAERRKRLAAAAATRTSSLTSASPEDQHSMSRTLYKPGAAPAPDVGILLDSQDLATGLHLEAGVAVAPSPAEPSAGIFDIHNDMLIDAYYKDFHKFHPFVLPQKHLIECISQEPETQPVFDALIAIIRFIGHICKSQSWSAAHQANIDRKFAEATQNSPFMVQCRLLYSIVLFWYKMKQESKQQLDAAVQLAIDLSMHQQDFATDNGAKDAVLTESWRRTWWSVFIIEAYYAGTLGAMNFATLSAEATTELPCEEHEYELGNIPEPSTLQDFDSREFDAEDTTFSSFAYLVGAVRCTTMALSISPKSASKEGSKPIIQAADAAVDGWMLLLPEDKKQVMSKTGNVDELMFQAILVVHVSIIGLHRPLSDLKFNAVENLSTCAREPPLDNPKTDLINIHTVRVLRAVEAQVRLLALPTQSFSHSPFITCMVSEGSLVLLSACNFLLKDKELAIARDQIRMIIGCLKTLGILWPRTADNVREIQTIARQVLAINPRSSTSGRTPTSSSAPSLSESDRQDIGPSEDGFSSSDNELLAALSTMDSICGWYTVGDLGPDTSWWVAQ